MYVSHTCDLYPANLTGINKGVGSTVGASDALGTAALGKGKEKAESNTEADPPNRTTYEKGRPMTIWLCTPNL